MIRRVSRSALVATVAGTLVALFAPPAPGHADSYVPRFKEYVALGDSYSADVFATFPPTTRYAPFDCAQSVNDYPHQVARAFGIPRFRDATCGSATTYEMTHPQSLPLGGVNPPQFDRLRPTTDLVTLGIGGNDIGLAGAVETCLSLLPIDLGIPLLGSPCKKRFVVDGVDTLAAKVAPTGDKIRRTIRRIKARSPHASIFLVNYLNAIPASGRGCWPIVPIVDGDVAYLQSVFVKMNAMIGRVARATGVHLVDTYRPTLGHDVCQVPGVRYVEGLLPVSTSNLALLAFPFHPNNAGANAQAQAAIRTIAHS